MPGSRGSTSGDPLRPAPPRLRSPLALLDGASMWFRSYFGVPSSITAPDGRPVNAVRGFIDSMAVVITQQKPSRLAVCLDLDWRPQFRVDLIPSYKAHRVAEPEPQGEPDIEDVPDDLTPQVDMIMELLDAFGIPTAGAPGFEADDVLGTLAAAEKDDPVVVVSGDRDLLQVVADDPVPVRVLYLGRGLSKATLFGPAEVAEHYGVPADRAGPAYAELALLRGDPSDGLPGVPGVGEKTAATLLAQHGSLEQILAAAHDPKSKMAKGLRAQTAGCDRLHRGRASGGAGHHRRARNAFDADRRATPGRRRPETHRRAGDGTGRRVVDRAVAEGARRAARVNYCGRPTS